MKSIDIKEEYWILRERIILWSLILLSTFISSLLGKESNSRAALVKVLVKVLILSELVHVKSTRRAKQMLFVITVSSLSKDFFKYGMYLLNLYKFLIKNCCFSICFVKHQLLELIFRGNLCEMVFLSLLLSLSFNLQSEYIGKLRICALSTRYRKEE